MAASMPLSLRVPAPLADELVRMARLTGRTPGAMALRLIEESLRMHVVPGVEFRDTPHGRSAAIAGTGLHVWEMCDVIESYEGDCTRILREFPHWTQRQLDAAMQYKALYPEEVVAAQEHNRLLGERMAAGNYPGVRVFVVPMNDGADAES